MSLPPVPNTEIKSDNVWLGWFRRIQEILNRWIIIVGSSVVIGRFNQGTTFPALELTRSTDTNGFTTLEFSNAAGLRRLEILATGTTAGYGIPANQSGLNAQTGFTLSINDTSSVFFNGQSILLERSIDNGSIIRALNPNAGTGAFARLQASNGTASVIIDQFGTGFAGSFANQGWIYTATAQPLILGTAGVERMRIDSTGQVTIGTASVGKFNSRLVVAGASGQSGIGTLAGAGTSALDTGISINQNDQGGTLLLLASRNTSSGLNTESAVYIVRFYFDGNNAPTTTYVGGSSNFVTFGVSGSNTLTLTNAAGGNVTYSWFGNK